MYKSDQETAVVSVIQEAVRLSKLPDNPYHGILTSAVPETSAAGQSQSNGRAERAVQQVEDLARTYLSPRVTSGLEDSIVPSHCEVDRGALGQHLQQVCSLPRWTNALRIHAWEESQGEAGRVLGTSTLARPQEMTSQNGFAVDTWCLHRILRDIQ